MIEDLKNAEQEESESESEDEEEHDLGKWGWCWLPTNNRTASPSMTTVSGPTSPSLNGHPPPLPPVSSPSLNGVLCCVVLCCICVVG